MCVRGCTRVCVCVLAHVCVCETSICPGSELPMQSAHYGSLSLCRLAWFQTELKMVSVHGAPALWVARSDLVPFLDLAILYLMERCRHPAVPHVLTGGLWGFQADPGLGWSSLLQALAMLRSCGPVVQSSVPGVLGHQSIIWRTCSSGFSFYSWSLGFSVLSVRISYVFFFFLILF